MDIETNSKFKLKIRSGDNKSFLYSYSKPDHHSRHKEYSFNKDTVFHVLEVKGQMIRVKVGSDEFWMGKWFNFVEP